MTKINPDVFDRFSMSPDRAAQMQGISLRQELDERASIAAMLERQEGGYTTAQALDWMYSADASTTTEEQHALVEAKWGGK